jgi:hypothetical protein
MTLAWFVYTNEVVSGPYSTETLQKKIFNGEIAAESFVWWKGQRQWMSVSVWKTQINEILKTQSQRAASPMWYLDVGGSPRGPLTENELLNTLRSYPSLNKTKLWSAGMDKWTSLFDLSDILEKLGVSRREHERAPLMGTIAVSRSNEDPQTYILHASSISLGGMGITGHQDFRIGDRLTLTLKTHEISSSIPLRATVVYVSKNSYAGLRFDTETISPEVAKLISNYIQQFMTEDSASRAA